MKQFRRFSILISIVLMAIATTAQTKLPADRVNPFIGTGGHGHTYPGALVPFGMVQLSPDTRLTGWDGCSAYHYSDSIVYGFSHTHLSGTGCSDYGDILLMPTVGKPALKNKDYASGFSHKNEIATPGYYSVFLDKYKVQAELTATARAGFHKYIFPAGKESNVIIDLVHRDEVIESSIEIIDNKEIRGLRRSKNWADDQYVYFVIRFSKKFNSYGIADDDKILEGISKKEGKKLKAFVTFETDQKEAVYVKVGISAVSVEGALHNLDTEIPEWDFNVVKSKAHDLWNKELGKIEVTGHEKDMEIFYTALYHSMSVPNLYMDVDRKYRGRDNKIHIAADFDYYTVFSLWDTYRAEHPLLSIIDQKRTNDFIRTFIRQYEEGGRLPVWELSSNETFCMIGYHSIPVIADAVMKGIAKFDVEKAFEAMKHSATEGRQGIDHLMTYGYINGDLDNESVSKTLEYAYDDWCIAQVAQFLKKDADYKTFIKRAQFYKNVYDQQTGFMRARINGGFFKPFDPSEVNNHYTEANSWQYSFYVPQDISGLSNLMGGNANLSAKLDNLFSAPEKTTGREQSDISGLIGQYAHGNEPSHHIAYLYDYLGEPWKTQQKVHQILETLYKADQDGLSGNEDCGQMSAWYVMSAMGIYSVCPGQQQYAIGTPQFDKVVLNLENGKKFTIKADNLTKKNFYVQSITLNGQPYFKCYLNHTTLMANGELVLNMGPVPNKQFATRSHEVPTSEIKEELIVPVPVIDAPAPTFQDSLFITMYQAGKNDIYYTLDGSEPTVKSTLYTQPVIVKKNVTLKAMAHSNEYGNSYTSVAHYAMIPSGRRISILSAYENQYTAGGPLALIDGLRGTTNWRIGRWQGYLGTDFEAVMELGKTQSITKISVGFLQDVGAYIMYPRQVEILISEDGYNYQPLTKIMNDTPDNDYKPQMKDFTYSLPTDQKGKMKAQYIKVIAKKYGLLPAWHEGAGSESHIFIDEIFVE